MLRLTNTLSSSTGVCGGVENISLSDSLESCDLSHDLSPPAAIVAVDDVSPAEVHSCSDVCVATQR